MNIVPKLNLNKHPKDCVNNSLVNAENIMFDVDQNVLCNENVLEYTTEIIEYTNDELNKYFERSGHNFNCEIVGSINCNDEIVYFVSYIDTEDNKKMILVRYSDITDTGGNCKIYLIEDSLNYHDGEIIGTFTYNRNNELIIVFSEYKEDNSLNEPLRTFNLDNIDDLIYSPLVPEVIIPKVEKYLYINKPWYKGQNHIFISFKINEDTYTQWYNLHKNIYLDTIENKYFINASIHGVKDGNNNEIEYILQRKIDMSNRSDLCDLSFNLTLSDINYYSFYRLAIINMTKDSTRTFISYDINSNIKHIEVTANLFKEHDGELANVITSYYNYYNVKEIENFKNKLFISNYKEEFYDNEALNDIARNVIGTVYTAFEVDTTQFGYFSPTNINANLEKFIQGRVNNKAYYQIYKNLVKCDLVDSMSGSQLLINDNNNIKIRDIDIFLDVIWLLYPYTNNTNYVNFNPTNGITTEYIASVKNKLISNLNSAFRIHITFADNTSISDTITTSNNDNEFPNSSLILVPFTPIFGTSHGWYIFKYVSGENKFKLIKNKSVKYFTIDGINTTFNTSALGTGYALNQIFYDVTTPTQEDQAKSQLSIKTLIPGEYYQFFIHYVNKYGNASLGFPISINGKVTKHNNINGENVYNINELNANKYSNGKLDVIKLKVSNITIPDGYVGWFISYAKFEHTLIYHGFRLKDDSSQVPQDLTVDAGNNAGRVLSVEFDILDKLEMNNNIIEYLAIEENGNLRREDITHYKFVPSNSVNNMFRSSYLGVNYKNYNEAIPSTYVRIKKEAKDDNGNLLLYLSKNKLLIPLSYVYYNDVVNYTEQLFDGNYNGVISKFEAIEYKRDIIYDAGDGTYRNINGTKVTKDQLDTYIDVHTWFDYSTYFNESKRYRSNPQIIVNGDYDEHNPKLTVGVIVQGRDIIDLFENNQININENNPKYETSYYEFNKYSYIFDKTIRRSDVISDESLENSWRKFETNQYINIKENKGIIMNLCSVGNIFLVHTEHSLFQFDFNDRLTSNGGYVEVDQKDIFDSRYTEMFNSELGYGGLQERRAAIAGDFGYIWYNNDFNHFFALSKEGPKVISEDIDTMLKIINPKNIRFGDDKHRARLIIRYDIKDGMEVISYSYKLATFISRHSYSGGQPSFFAYTKDHIQFINNDKTKNGKFIYNRYNNCIFSIICSTSYDEVKFIEFLKYKFTRILNVDRLANLDYTKKQNDIRYTPECGERLYVVSDDCESETLYLRYVNDNASNKFDGDFPYYELGQFNLNKLIDKNTKGRLFGNYFVFTFVIWTTDNNKINFESIDYSLTKIRK